MGDLPSVRHCKSCDRPIRWVLILPSRKKHPVDAASMPNGTIEIKRGLHSANWYGRVVEKARRESEEGLTLYVSHFATCPDANRHRKGNR